MNEVYVSVDIETSGPIVGVHSLLSFGACICENMSKTFSREVIPISEMQDDDAMHIVGKPLGHFYSTTPPKVAFTDFHDWLKGQSEGSKLVFVGFNAAFDWAFVNWYFLTFLGSNPFGAAALDIKSYYGGFAGVAWEETRSSRIPAEFKPIGEHSHDPLDDAIEQALIFTSIRTAAEKRNG